MVAGSTQHLLPDEVGRALLEEARRHLSFFLTGEPAPAAEPAPLPPDHPFLEKRGVFVTLTNGGDLRGCTGYVEGVGPLLDEVRDLVVSSASRDHRFQPVRADELSSLHIEISVLTPPHPIKPAEVEIGRHGLVARMQGRSGLLLPQVPVEWGWDRDQFLRRTCEKAGLPPESWRSPECRLLGFEAQIFDE